MLRILKPHTVKSVAQNTKLKAEDGPHTTET